MTKISSLKMLERLFYCLILVLKKYKKSEIYKTLSKL